MGPRNLKELEVWREAIERAKRVYATSRTWPKEEAYGLISQVRRAATSIASNLAEGLGRGTSAAISRFRQISLGSASRLFSQVELSHTLGYIQPAEVAGVTKRLDSLTHRVAAYANHWEGKR